MKKESQRNFRPWPENQKRLELASRLGINVSELINEVLKNNLESALRDKSKKLQAALASN
jgi:hypothetical protein